MAHLSIAGRLSRTLLALSCLVAVSACSPNIGDGVKQPEAVLPDEPGDKPQADPAAPTDAGKSSDVLADQPTGDAESVLLKSEYSFLDPQGIVSRKLLGEAVAYFDANKSRFNNQDYITVVDFSVRSNEHRFFVINMKTGEVFGTVVAHGKGSDPSRSGYATVFSNTVNSNASSLGFYATAETYSGKHGFSLMIDGLSTTNSNVRKRVVVVHGADYVRDANVIQGRSFGCFALPMDQRTEIINMIKGGSMIYAGLSK